MDEMCPQSFLGLTGGTHQPHRRVARHSHMKRRDCHVDQARPSHQGRAVRPAWPGRGGVTSSMNRPTAGDPCECARHLLTGPGNPRIARGDRHRSRSRGADEPEKEGG